MLGTGKKYIVVGMTKGRTNVVVNGAPKTEPYQVADCIHVWQTGRTQIESFKEDARAGFSPLPERTVCAEKSS